MLGVLRRVASGVRWLVWVEFRILLACWPVLVALIPAIVWVLDASPGVPGVVLAAALGAVLGKGFDLAQTRWPVLQRIAPPIPDHRERA